MGVQGVHHWHWAAVSWQQKVMGRYSLPASLMAPNGEAEAALQLPGSQHCAGLPSPAWHSLPPSPSAPGMEPSWHVEEGLEAVWADGTTVDFGYFL